MDITDTKLLQDMTFKAIKFITISLLISLIFFTKAYADDPVGFITDIKGQVKKIIGKEKVLGGTTTQAANILGPGHIKNHAGLPSWIGEYDKGGMSERVKDVAETFTAYGLETIASENVKKSIARKIDQKGQKHEFFWNFIKL